MKWVVSFGRFWYDFVVGDDWRLAAGVVIAIVAVDFATHHGADWWWLLPFVAVVLLAISVYREMRSRLR